MPQTKSDLLVKFAGDALAGILSKYPYAESIHSDEEDQAMLRLGIAKSAWNQAAAMVAAMPEEVKEPAAPLPWHNTLNCAAEPDALPMHEPTKLHRVFSKDTPSFDTFMSGFPDDCDEIIVNGRAFVAKEAPYKPKFNIGDIVVLAAHVCPDDFDILGFKFPARVTRAEPSVFVDGCRFALDETDLEIESALAKGAQKDDKS